MVTIISKDTTESVINSATVKVAGARNAAHALELALNDLDRHGWICSIERYESTISDDGSYILIMY